MSLIASSEDRRQLRIHIPSHVLVCQGIRDLVNLAKQGNPQALISRLISAQYIYTVEFN